MIGDRVDVRTEDGSMDGYLFTPTSEGMWPAVIVYMDAFGIRPELGEMARRLASSGYVVALPNLYYRTGAFPSFDKRAVLVEGPERDRFKGMIQSINVAMVMRDTAAIIEMLDARPEVHRGKIGAVGYCMGGGYALAVAGTFPERVAAAASFHGGSLATDKADSPHRFAPQMRATVYVGAAEIDPAFPDDQKVRLERALADAGVDYTLETYAGAKHGFAVNGHLVYDREASERHWTRLLELFDTTLKRR
jgi:carboxymethylenebutenolidase